MTASLFGRGQEEDAGFALCLLSQEEVKENEELDRGLLCCSILSETLKR